MVLTWGRRGGSRVACLAEEPSTACRHLLGRWGWAGGPARRSFRRRKAHPEQRQRGLGVLDPHALHGRDGQKPAGRQPDWSVDASQERVHSTEAGEVTPMRPISQPNFLTLIQDPIGGVSPRSTEKTRELTALCSWSISQELSCGRGKSALNWVRKAMSVKL